MNSIEIYGFADREICGGCEGHCGEGDCVPGVKKPTKDLVAEFETLLAGAHIPAEVTFYEAVDENLERHDDVKKILGMADLTPAIVLNGKLLFFGGFSPEGLVQEVSRRV